MPPLEHPRQADPDPPDRAVVQFSLIWILLRLVIKGVILLDRITSFHGRLSDSNLIWWPFLFLKPDSPGTPITWRRLLLMIPCFAAWILPSWLLRELFVGDLASLQLADIAKVYGYLLLTFALWFNLVTAPLWNRRARSLGETCN